MEDRGADGNRMMYFATEVSSRARDGCPQLERQRLLWMGYTWSLLVPPGGTAVSMADVQLSAGQEVALGGSKFTSSLDSDAFNIPSLGGGEKSSVLKESCCFFSD